MGKWGKEQQKQDDPEKKREQFRTGPGRNATGRWILGKHQPSSNDKHTSTPKIDWCEQAGGDEVPKKGNPGKTVHPGAAPKQHQTQKPGHQRNGKKVVFFNVFMKLNKLACGFDEWPLNEVLECRTQEEQTGREQGNLKRLITGMAGEVCMRLWILSVLIRHGAGNLSGIFRAFHCEIKCAMKNIEVSMAGGRIGGLEYGVSERAGGGESGRGRPRSQGMNAGGDWRMGTPALSGGDNKQKHRLESLRHKEAGKMPALP